MRKVGNPADNMDVTDRLPCWRPPRRTPYNWMLDWTRRIWQRSDALPFCVCVIRAIRGEFYFGAGSQLLFLAEFLEARISPERIEHGIESEQRGSERCTHTQCTPVGERE
jgi:hypothetical protein